MFISMLGFSDHPLFKVRLPVKGNPIIPYVFNNNGSRGFRQNKIREHLVPAPELSLIFSKEARLPILKSLAGVIKLSIK
jgi:hypothetical protein